VAVANRGGEVEGVTLRAAYGFHNVTSYWPRIPWPPTAFDHGDGDDPGLIPNSEDPG